MDLKIAVTPSGYDNIGAVLNRMEYKHSQLSYSALADLKTLRNYSVIFINCSGDIQKHANKASDSLRHYVEQGGTIYTSDWASSVIIAAFKEYAVFGNGGDARHLTATVKDKGLASQIGNSLSLNFDAGSWHIVNSCAEQVRTYLALGNQSLLISFRHGKGQVIFTSFHNHAQVSKIEERLLQFLVLKPVLADVAAELGDFAWSDTKELQENVGTVNSGGESEWFEYRLPTSRPFKIMLNWKGEANLALEVNGPGASITEQSDHPPVAVDFPEALAGIWRYRIKALSATIKNFPFVLLAGTPARVDEMSAPLLPAELIQRLAANQPIQVDPEILHQIKLLNEKDNEQDLDIKFIEE